MGLNGGSPLLQTEPFAWRQRPTPGMAAGRGNRCYIQDGGRPRQPLLCTRWRRAARPAQERMRRAPGRAPSRPPRPPHTRGLSQGPPGSRRSRLRVPGPHLPRAAVPPARPRPGRVYPRRHSGAMAERHSATPEVAKRGTTEKSLCGC